MESQFLSHIFEEFPQDELPELVQWLHLREQVPSLGFSDKIENS